MRALTPMLGILLIAFATSATPATREDQILILGNVSGSQTVSAQNGNAARAEYSYNDRGRGEHIVATWKLDPAGVPIEYSGRGNDYMKASVAETFRITGGKASWRNRTEHGEQSLAGEMFYMPANAPPEFLGVLARALLKAPEHRLALLPAGEARIESAGSVTLQVAGSGKAELTLYRIHGLDFSPTPLWLDHDGNTAAIASGWLSALPAAYRDSLATLLDAQTAANGDWSANLAKQQTHVPAGDLVIRNARLFDPRDLSVTSGMSVLVRGERIVRVAADADLKIPDGAEVIDAAAKFLMPGLWDNHQHFGDNIGVLDLANGVTSTRDMANDTDGFLKRIARFDAGTELGPRVFKAGIIDGTGPLAGPTKMRVDSAAEALRSVDWYADHGYGQIKIYSSLKPELVPIIADAAHARGLRVSGHVPAFMSAQQFVEGGADEIQHLNFFVLNFLFDTVKETRNMNRFTAVAEHARDLPPEDPKVQDFIAFLKRHHTVLDPTMNVFEALFCGDPAAVMPGLEAIVARFPPQIRRGMLSGALAVPKGQEAAYRDAFPAMLRLLKALYDAGVTIIPGTDSLAGYGLHHEFELYARAGIPPAQVLRMATLTSAQVIGVDRERGVVAPGKLADMILVDGDPTANIADINKLVLVIKGGKIYDPAQIERALGIAADKPRQDVVRGRSVDVMPFDLHSTTHIFTKTKTGGTQQVVAKDPNDSTQVRLTREHLKTISEQFSTGDFSGPTHVHGAEMPGLTGLKAAKPSEIKILYQDVPSGAEITYSTDNPALVAALHQWFDAQLADHGHDAMPGHSHPEMPTKSSED
jgi:imidazolonepropionase-like amidohydrolase